MKLLKIIKNSLTTLLLGAVMAGSSLAMPLTTLAADNAPSAVSGSKQAACDGIGLSTDSGGCSGGDESAVTRLVGTVVNLLSVVVGIAAVIMLIVAGLRYVTSGGEASKVSGAKSAIIYAIVGIVIVALAQFIIHVVLDSARTGNIN